MRKNEYKISYEIVNALSKTGSHNRRRLKGIIQSQQYLGYPVSEKLYRYNVNKLINSNVIKELNKEDWIRGKSMLLDLTESTKEALKLKTFRLKSNRKTIDKHIEQTIEDKREKAYQILFYSSIIIPIVPDHPISLVEFPNFYTPGLPFAHLFSSSQPDKEFVKESISLLEKEKKLIRITDQAERQIFHIEEDIRSLILDAWNLLEGLILPAFRIKIKYIRNRTKKERGWYQLIYGDKIADQEFIECKEHLRNLKNESNKSAVRQRIKENKEYLEAANSSIIFYINQLKEKHKNTIEKHKSLFNFLIDGVIYPRCLRDDNPIKGNGTPKVVFCISRDTLMYTSKAGSALL